jgi:hypothetical protein
LSVATMFPDRGKAAGEASNQPNSQNFAVRIALCYSIKRAETPKAPRAVDHLTVMRQPYRSMDA